MVPNEIFLATDRVLLRPLTEADSETVHLLAQDEGMWQYFSLNLADKSQLQQWMTAAFHDWQVNTKRPFTLMDKASGRIAGSTSMGNISLHDLRLEIGWSWLAKEFRSTGLNRHAKFAMMRYAFEYLQFERVEFKTDVQNARAKKGLENIGGRPEGILRSHMTMWNNRRRDSIYYSVLKNEWPELKQTIFKDITTYEVY